MEALVNYQEKTNSKTTNLRVNVTFDLTVDNNSEDGAAVFAKTIQETLKNDQSRVLDYLQSRNYKVKVQARRNRKPKNKTV